MHIILSLLGAIVTILILLRRMESAGFRLSDLNPYWWFRRRKWQKQYHADPVYSIEKPMEATAGLMYVAAKCSGDISREQKDCMLSLFQEEFHLSEQEAIELLSSCAFLIPDEDKVTQQLDKFLEPSLEHFSKEQRASSLQLISQVIACENRVADKQRVFLENTKALLTPPERIEKRW